MKSISAFKKTAFVVSLATLLVCTLVFGSAQAQAPAAPRIVKIGVLLPMSGGWAEIGRTMVEGIQFVLDEIVQTGGINLDYS